MAKENVEGGGVEDGIIGQGSQETNVVFTVPRVKVIIVLTGLFASQVFWKFRVFSGGVQIMITGNDHIAFLPDQRQACGSISCIFVLIEGLTEAGNIAQTNEFVIPLCFSFPQDFLQSEVIFVYVGYNS